MYVKQIIVDLVPCPWQNCTAVVVYTTGELPTTRCLKGGGGTAGKAINSKIQQVLLTFTFMCKHDLAENIFYLFVTVRPICKIQAFEQHYTLVYLLGSLYTPDPLLNLNNMQCQVLLNSFLHFLPNLFCLWFLFKAAFSSQCTFFYRDVQDCMQKSERPSILEYRLLELPFQHNKTLSGHNLMLYRFTDDFWPTLAVYIIFILLVLGLFQMAGQLQPLESCTNSWQILAAGMTKS